MIKIPLAGTLSDVDIKDALFSNKLRILQFSEKNLTASGYNLTPSGFVFSTTKGITEKIREDENGKYVHVSAHDTVLIMTKEWLELSDELCGTIHSRVRIVSQGFGHISTTIDPRWKGPLLVALSNPTAITKKFCISKISVRGIEDNPFCTVVFHKMIQKAKKRHDNPPQRIDVLREYIAKPPKWLYRLFTRESYDEFSSLVLNLHTLLPGYKSYTSPTIEKLKSLHKEYSDIYKSVVDRSIMSSVSTSIYISEDLRERSLFTEQSWGRIDTEIEDLRNKEINTSTLPVIADSIEKIVSALKYEIDNAQYGQYLLELEGYIPKTQPRFLRYWDTLHRARREIFWLAIMIVVLSIFIYRFRNEPTVLWPAIPGIVAVLSFILKTIYK